MLNKLSEALLQRAMLDEATIKALWQAPALRGRSFALRLYQSGLLNSDQLYRILLDLGARDATAHIQQLPAPRVLALVPSRLAETGSLIPFQRIGHRLHVAMLDPSNDRAIEDLALFTGLAVEPFLAHARDLFRSLYQAYAIPVPSQMSHFDPASAHETELLPPPPGVDLPPIGIVPSQNKNPQTHSQTESSSQDAALDWEDPPHSGVTYSVFGAVGRSPLEQSLRDLDPSLLDEVEVAAVDTAQSSQLEDATGQRSQGVDDDKAAATARISGWQTPDILPDRVPGWRLAQQAAQSQAQRRALPVQQAMDKLKERFVHIAVFFVQGDLAVGWDGMGGQLSQKKLRDVLLPLRPESSLQRAVERRACVLADIASASSTDRILLGFVGAPQPQSWAVAPVLVNTEVEALIFADSEQAQLAAVEVGLIERTAVEMAEQLRIMDLAQAARDL